MRIALINSIRFYGGGEKRVLRAARDFERRGHGVTVIGLRGGDLGVRCHAAGIPFSPVRFGRYFSPGTITGLARAIRKAAPDALVCYDERSTRAASAARLLLRTRAVPLLFYVGLEGHYKNKLNNRLLVGPGVTRYVANAEALRRELLGFGWVPPEKVVVIRDGVDPRPVEEADPGGIREELGASADDIVAVVAARLVPEKGHAFLLQVLARLGEHRRSLKVWVAGEGPEMARLQRQVVSSGLQGCVSLLGFRPDVPRLLRAADLLCHPSRREGIPNVVREAMVAGLPVVATAATGTPEVVADRETGLLGQVDDGPAMEANLREVLEDGALRDRLGQAGRRRALAEFSEDTCAARWLDLLGSVVKR